MPIRQAPRQNPESTSVPRLQIVAELQPAGEGDGASVGFLPGVGQRVGLIALFAAVAIAAGLYGLLHQSHRVIGRATLPAAALAHQRWPRARPVPILTSPRTAVGASGVRLMAVGGPGFTGSGATSSDVGSSSSSSPSAAYSHELSASDLINMVNGGSGYQPSAALVDAYRGLGARYAFPWRVLAAIEYIQGGYVNAFAGESAPAEQSLAAQLRVGGQRAVNPHVLAGAVAEASRPSAQLVADARELAADGAAQSPARAVYTYMHDSAASQQAVMTLAQEIDAAPTPGATGAPAQLVAMRNEAHLLNGIPYSWGGGHQNPAWVVSSGYDCSGFVSEVLHAAGYLGSPQTTQTLPGSAGIVKGPGKYVTIYDRTIATIRVLVKKRQTIRKAVNPAAAGVHLDKGRHANSIDSVTMTLPKWVGQWKTIKITKLVPSLDNTNNDEHVIIDLGGQWWESGGSTADGGAAMVHRILNPDSGYLKSFNMILHPKGL